MKVEDYPKFTIIMRGYTTDQAMAIMEAMDGFEKDFGIEVTMNTDHCIDIIKNGYNRFGNKYLIGAGTVMNIDEEKEAIDAGAKFLLGPQEFTKEMIDYAHDKGVITVPAAMTPTEVTRLFNNGADIVKVFPASTVKPDYFKAIQAPLGKLPLMAVGGVSIQNAGEFLDNGCDYLGMGSKLFKKEDIQNKDIKGLSKSLATFVKDFKERGALV
ncbi:bifunctional 4-hydroxy-2-oxoglutarate aldolase/2-dehydro-3-deoxy-phosphogluconate aldolase [Companilactobacillus sp. HBUAS56257]|uniref:bifunctional 4-hydroxy-2-oxoglutarate aldolase/2-dehydro-3-deoxy-phosphogluconate aldolase n=1 Tax=Companilactobacillus sp. HBUAS56257 TaxID=3109360 RepID=UPI002FEF80A1